MGYGKLTLDNPGEGVTRCKGMDGFLIFQCAVDHLNVELCWNFQLVESCTVALELLVEL